MLGTLDGKGTSDTRDPVEQQSGHADKTVPYSQSEAMEAALTKVGVTVKLVRVPGVDHGSDFPGNTQKMDWPAMSLEWFDTHLKQKR